METLADLNVWFDEYRKKMKNQPVAVRWISKAFLDKFDLAPAVSEIVRETGPKELTSTEYVVELATQISDKVDVRLFKPSFTPFIVLVAINLSTGIALKLLL